MRIRTSLKVLLSTVAVGAFVAAYWKLAIPVHRVPTQSELVMLGDLDGDHRWSAPDRECITRYAADPRQLSDTEVWKLDLNRNDRIDPEDIVILDRLIAAQGDPYAAEEAAHRDRVAFPRPRELYRYRPAADYRVRPMWALPYPNARNSVLDWLGETVPPQRLLTYEGELDAAIYAEAVRFDQSWRQRAEGLLPIERDYAAQKLARVKILHNAGEKFELLLALMELVEDAETLSVLGQPPIAVQMLTFRDHLREILVSPLYADFAAGRVPWQNVTRAVSAHLLNDLGLNSDLETLGPPRGLGDLQNYFDRAEWQYFKSTTREDDFRALIAYAQHDPRYLRAVARTSRKLQDTRVANHNLPMVLLFREALRIAHGDKKKAAGLLDEALRIPFAWVKSIPRERLPASLAYENFLLPGNKEDGLDKSRHWNVFGAICLYKSPRAALDLALRREMQDLRTGNCTEPEMREFLRDMIGNLNGMFHVMAINPELLSRDSSRAAP